MKKAGKSKLTIIATAMVTVLALSGCIVGTMAWFAAQQQARASGAFIRVATQNYSVDSVKLYKFNYAKDPFDENSFLFLDPEEGGVYKFNYDSENDRFVDDDNNPTTKMNLYDPLERMISGDSFKLSKFNSNAIYEVVISTSTPTVAANLDPSSVLNIARSERNSGVKYLSDYVDFDIFTEDELKDKITNDQQQEVWNTNLYNGTTGNALYLPTDYNSAIDLSRILSGTIGPNNHPESTLYTDYFASLGTIYDLYFDKTLAKVYKKQTNGWQEQTITTLNNNPNTNPEASGSDGDYYIDSTNMASGNSILYVHSEDLSPWKNVNPEFFGDVEPWSYNYSGSTLAVNNLFLYSAVVESVKTIKLYKCNDVSKKNVAAGWTEITSLTKSDKDPNASPLSAGSANDYFVDTTNNSDVLYVYNKEPSWKVVPTTNVALNAPVVNTGNVSDGYVDLSTNDYYVKESTGWVKQSESNVSSAPGETPDNSLTSEYYIRTYTENDYHDLWKKENGVWTKKTYETDYLEGNSAPENNDLSLASVNLYVDGEKAEVYVRESSGWVKKSNLSSEEIYYKVSYLSSNKKSHPHFYGSNADSISLSPKNIVYYNSNGTWGEASLSDYGIDLPKNNTGSLNGVYFDYGSNSAYVKDSSGWVNQNAKKGSNNPNGNPSANPAVAQVSGNSGDYYIDTSNNDALYLYDEDNEPWKRVDVKYVFTDAPTSHVFTTEQTKAITTGDYYLNTTNYTLFTASVDAETSEITWTSVANVSHEDLNPNVGVKVVGSEVPWSHEFTESELADFKNGNLYLNTSTNKAYACLDTSSLDDQTNWEIKNNVAYNSASPLYVVGTEGYYYIDTSNNLNYVYIFNKDKTPWKLISASSTGSGKPQNNVGNIGDSYVDTTNHDVYIKETSGWVEKNTLRTQGVPTGGENGDYAVDLSSNPKRVTFSQKVENNETKYYTKFYINVNYAPRQLEQYAQDSNDRFLVNVDFAFSFAFSGVSE